MTNKKYSVVTIFPYVAQNFLGCFPRSQKFLIIPGL